MDNKYKDYFTQVEASALSGEILAMTYVRLSEVPLWDNNPKTHDMGKLIESIEAYGFRDPSEFDISLGGIVAGNGRVTALRLMEEDNYPVPRGIPTDTDGRWYIPVIFGIDAESRAGAIRYGIDHNNLTMMGSDEFTAWDIKKMYDQDAYMESLGELESLGDMPATVDLDDYEYLMNNINFDNSDDDSDGNGDSETNDDGASSSESDDNEEVIVVTTTNFNLIGDIFDAVQELLEYNPGWDAKISLK